MKGVSCQSGIQNGKVMNVAVDSSQKFCREAQDIMVSLPCVVLNRIFYICLLSDQAFECVIPENVHTPPTEGFLNLTLPTPPEIPFLCHTFFQKIGLLKPPFPLEFPVTFLGVDMDIFSNYTMTARL